MTFYKKVQKFTEASAECSQAPRCMTKKEWEFLKKMIADEISEVDAAFAPNEDTTPLLVEQVDGVVDIAYYMFNAIAKCGIDLDPIIDIVCQANLSKIVDNKVLRDEDPDSPRYGKILKPANWKDPMPLIEAELNAQSSKGFKTTDLPFDSSISGEDLLTRLKRKAGVENGSN